MAKTPTDIRSKARSHTESAIRVLVQIMEDVSAPVSVRAQAATEILNRGLGRLTDPERFVPDRRDYYVYSIHGRQGELLYIGKGCGRRSFQSATRLNGRSRVRAVFTSEKAALAFERRLIQRFVPPANVAQVKRA